MSVLANYAFAYKISVAIFTLLLAVQSEWSCVVLVGALWEDVLAKTWYGMLRTSEGSRP